MYGHRYTAEQIAYLERHAIIERRYLAIAFNNKFGTAVSADSLKQFCLRRGIKTGRTGCFEPGHRPYNAGTKGLHKGGCSTSFKPGHRPQTWVPVGTEVVEKKDGYTKVKVAEPRTWKYKHVMIYEGKHGPLPKGQCVIFADSDKQNFDPDNLVAVERRELLFLNRKALIKPDKDLTKTAVNIAKVAVRVAELNRKERE